jgi:hypothetical protein
MKNQRKTDTEAYRKFRPSRFIKDDGKWYFSTREATVEGPFGSRSEAESKLATYLKLIASGFMPRDTSLNLHPLDPLDLPESTPLH